MLPLFLYTVPYYGLKATELKRFSDIRTYMAYLIALLYKIPRWIPVAAVRLQTVYFCAYPFSLKKLPDIAILRRNSRVRACNSCRRLIMPGEFYFSMFVASRPRSSLSICLDCGINDSTVRAPGLIEYHSRTSRGY